MVVVVPGHHGEELVERPAAARVEVHAGPPPRARREPAQELERLAAAPFEGGERARRVVRQVLPLLGPSVRIAPREPGLVRLEDLAEALEERLLVVPEGAEDFQRRPARRGGAARERRRAPARRRGGRPAGPPRAARGPPPRRS